MMDPFVQTRTVGFSLLIAVAAACMSPAAAFAQDDAAFLEELQKSGFRDVALQFAKDHPGAGAAAESKGKLDLLKAELNDPKTPPQRRGQVAVEAVVLARKMLKVPPPGGKKPADAKKQLAHANLRVFLGRMLLGQIRALFQNGVLVGLSKADLLRFGKLAEEALKVLSPAADTIARILEVMGEDDDFDKNWGERLYDETMNRENIAKYLAARVRLYAAWTLPKAVDPANPIPRVAAQVARRGKLLKEAAKQMDFWTRQSKASGVLHESHFLMGVIRWQQGKFTAAEASLKSAIVADAPIVVQFMARAALVRCMLEDKKYTAASEAIEKAIQWTVKQEKTLGANAESLMVLLKADITLSQASDAHRRGEKADYLRLKRSALAVLTKYAVSKPGLKSLLYQKYVERLLDDARAAAKDAPEAPDLLKPEDPTTQPATQPAEPELPRVIDLEADILPKPATLEPFELAALGAVMLAEKRYDAGRYYLRNLTARKDPQAEPFLNEAFFNLGVVLYNLGRNVKAADSFVALVARDPEYPRAVDGLEYAVKIYVGLLAKDATRISVRKNLERALTLAGKLPDGPEKKKLLVQWLFVRGDNLRHLKRFIEAVAQFEKVPVTYPQYYEARYDIVRSYYNYVEQLEGRKALDATMRPACRDAIERARKFLLYVDTEIARLKGTPDGDKLVNGSKLTVTDSRINDKGLVELWIVDMLVNKTPPGPGETKKDLLRKAVPMLEAFPNNFPAKPQRELVAQALGRLTEVWLALGDLDRAVKVLEDFKKRYPEGASGLIRLILDALLNEVERLKKIGLAGQAKKKAEVAVRLVESQIDWVKKFEKDPIVKRDAIYGLTQLAAGLYREAGITQKAVEAYGKLIVNRQKRMVEGMLEYVRKWARANLDATEAGKLTKDFETWREEDYAKADKLAGEGKWSEAAKAVELLRDNIYRNFGPVVRSKKQEVSPELTAIPDDATNYRGLALTYMEMKDYKKARRPWWKLKNTLRGPDQAGGDAKEKSQWWEALYNAIRCDVLDGRKDSCRLHKLRLDIIIKSNPDLGGPEWRDKILELHREIVKFVSN